MGDGALGDGDDAEADADDGDEARSDIIAVTIMMRFIDWHN